MKKASRSVAAPSRAGARRKSAEISADEASQWEAVARRYEESERAWARMTAPPDGDETWNNVEEHLLARKDGDPDRRWKYFSK